MPTLYTRSTLEQIKADGSTSYAARTFNTTYSELASLNLMSGLHFSSLANSALMSNLKRNPMSATIVQLPQQSHAQMPRLHYLNAEYGLKSWLLTNDHKRVAILYLISITFFFFGWSVCGHDPFGATDSDA